jgi:hypothetical protein
MDGQGAAHTFLVITDEGVYSNYSVNAHRCTEMEARQLAALRKDVARIIREKRFVPPDPNPYVEPTKQAGHYLDYGNHETIRLIQRVDGKPLMDDLSGGTGVAELIARYQSYVALARQPAPAERPAAGDGSARARGEA